MFTTLGNFTVRRHRPILAGTVLFLIIAVFFGSGVFGSLKSGGFDDPGSESSQASRVIEDEFGAADPNVVILVTATSGTVDDPTVAADADRLAAELAAQPGVSQVASYWSLGRTPALRSTDGTKAIVTARINGTDDEIDTRFEDAKRALEGADHGSITIGFGGETAVNAEMGSIIEADLGRAESIAVPLTIVMLVLVFGGLIAASLPLFVALLAVPGTLLSLFAISQLTDVSLYSINLTTALGLGLAIDYSLFIVNRFREELDKGLTPHDAVVRTVETAGRTVAFSALTVAASLAALLAFPMYFLRSFAYAGTSVVIVAALGSLVSLPALLAVVGTRVNSLRIFKRRTTTDANGFWHRLATTVMRRPIIIGVAVIGVLVLLGLPFARASFGLPGYESLPASAQSRQVSETLVQDFDGNSAGTFAVVITGVDPSERTADLDRLASEVSATTGVARVTGLTGTYVGGSQVEPADATSTQYLRPTGTWLTVTPSINPRSSAGETLVKDIRAIDTPLTVGVEGQAAQLVDTKAAIADRLPLALAIIAGITFVLLFLVFGSLLVPLKAIVLNLLSLSATFGAMVWIFQDGHLSSILGFTATGQIDISMPILMFCIAFGLSMDYEVFLLSRIKEEHDATGDNRHAVAMGLERTGRIVTAAAALLAITFIAFGTSSVTFMKMFGLGLSLAIVMDATIVRGLLVPAFMRLAGEANWWAPRWMRAIHDRFGISEGEYVPSIPTVGDRELVDAGRL